MDKVNISIIAQRAGVSSTTVSRVLNKSPLVKDSTVQRVREVMKALDYQPNELARSLRSSSTRTIGVIVSNVLNPFFTSVVRGIEDTANAAGYNIVLCNSDEKPEKEVEYVSTLIAKQVDGLIIASSEKIQNYSELIGNKLAVFIDRKLDECNTKRYDTVLVQNRVGAYTAVSHMLQQGFRRIGIITGQSNSTTGHERLLGYEAAIQEAGLAIDPELVKIGDFLGYTAYGFTMELLDSKKCDAIFAANNLILLGVLRALNERKIKVPSEMGLIAFDNLDWMNYCNPGISAIAQPTYELGRVAVDLFLERCGNPLPASPPREIVLDISLIVRGSSVRQTF